MEAKLPKTTLTIIPGLTPYTWCAKAAFQGVSWHFPIKQSKMYLFFSDGCVISVHQTAEKEGPIFTLNVAGSLPFVRIGFRKIVWVGEHVWVGGGDRITVSKSKNRKPGREIPSEVLHIHWVPNGIEPLLDEAGNIMYRYGEELFIYGKTTDTHCPICTLFIAKGDAEHTCVGRALLAPV
jgi:hypothetical protein